MWSNVGGGKPQMSYADLLRKAKEAKMGDVEASSPASGTSAATSSRPNAGPSFLVSPSPVRPGVNSTPPAKTVPTFPAAMPRPTFSSPIKAPLAIASATPPRPSQVNGAAKGLHDPTPAEQKPPLIADDKAVKPTALPSLSNNIWELRRQQRAAASAQAQTAPPAGRPASSPYTSSEAPARANAAVPAASSTKTEEISDAAKDAPYAASDETAGGSIGKAVAVASNATKMETRAQTPSQTPGSTKPRSSSDAADVVERLRSPLTPSPTKATEPLSSLQAVKIKPRDYDDAWLSRVALINEGHHKIAKEAVTAARADSDGERKPAWGKAVRGGALASPVPLPEDAPSAVDAKSPPPTTAAKGLEIKTDKGAKSDAASDKTLPPPLVFSAQEKSNWPSLDEAEKSSTASTTQSTPAQQHATVSTGSSTPGSAVSTGSGLEAIKGLQIRSGSGQRKAGKQWVEIVPEITHASPLPARKGVSASKGKKASRSSGSAERLSKDETKSEQASGSVDKTSSGSGWDEEPSTKTTVIEPSSDSWDEPHHGIALAGRKPSPESPNRQSKSSSKRRDEAAQVSSPVTIHTRPRLPSVPTHFNSDGSFSPSRLRREEDADGWRSAQQEETPTRGKKAGNRGRSGLHRSSPTKSSVALPATIDHAGLGASTSSPVRSQPSHAARYDNGIVQRSATDAPQSSWDQCTTFYEPGPPTMSLNHGLIPGPHPFSSPDDIPRWDPMFYDGARFWPAVPMHMHGHLMHHEHHHQGEGDQTSFPSAPPAPGQPQYWQPDAQGEQRPPLTAPAQGQPATPAPAPSAHLAGPMMDVPAAAMQLVTQVEYYLSERNLSGDVFLRSQMEPAAGWLPLSLIASFRRLRSMCDDLGVSLEHPEVKGRLLHSYHVELDEEGRRIRKRHEWEKWLPPPPGPPPSGLINSVPTHHSSMPPMPVSYSYEGPGGPFPFAVYTPRPEEMASGPIPPHPPSIPFYPSQPHYHSPHPANIYSAAQPNMTPTTPSSSALSYPNMISAPPPGMHASGRPTPHRLGSWQDPIPLHYDFHDGLYSPVAPDAGNLAMTGGNQHPQQQQQQQPTASRAYYQAQPYHQQQMPHTVDGSTPATRRYPDSNTSNDARQLAPAVVLGRGSSDSTPSGGALPPHPHSHRAPPGASLERQVSQQTDATNATTATSAISSSSSGEMAGLGLGLGGGAVDDTRRPSVTTSATTATSQSEGSATSMSPDAQAKMQAKTSPSDTPLKGKSKTSATKAGVAAGQKATQVSPEMSHQQSNGEGSALAAKHPSVASHSAHSSHTGEESEDDCLGIVAAEGLGGLVEANAK
ncbi:hypothetical protein BDZ90DRAFT_25569 [Jaminaea rosea]|uniref:HTH La-type RNA-binding domain-containing protein n=1 Tax=Jaminaea rosea TaxID=1569628 RepID=A0A316V3Q9_9BASI|nr:hypothetical protein BDZ90DRAFT_25569 [Jaminaea rosea]PWN30833.1 hypothetical protein BDZ90DRAFT_25569 [Jaminaea rosea]